MSDKLPKNFNPEKAGTKREEEPECRFCHEKPCKCDKEADKL